MNTTISIVIICLRKVIYIIMYTFCFSIILDCSVDINYVGGGGVLAGGGSLVINQT